MAIQLTAGEPLRAWITHKPGLTLEVEYSERSDGTSFSDTVTIEPRDHGVYALYAETSQLDPHGEWYVVVRASDGERFSQHFDVLPTPAHYDPVW